MPTRKVPLFDLAPIHNSLREPLHAAVTRVLDSNQFILGPEVDALEHELATYLGVSHAIACASGSDAIGLSLQALGIGPGDEVLVPAFTFFATAGYVTRIGATPVFCDIDPVTYNLCPTSVRRVLATHPRAKAIMPVHLYGGTADLDPLLAIAREHNLFVIEDGAQSIGAEYKGRPAHTFGHVSALSFFPTKNLGAAGDAGVVVTNDAALAHKLKALHVHGSHKRYYHDYVGWNSRLDAMQAAVLRVKLPHLESWHQARARNASLYQELLADLAPITLPYATAYQTKHVWNQFTIRVKSSTNHAISQRDPLRQWLAEQQIGTEVYYPVPLHLQECYRDLGYQPGDFPESELAAKQVLSLPVYPGLTTDDVQYVATKIREFFEG